MRRGAALAACALAACGATPLSNRITPGEEPFVIAVGEGSDGTTDLWAAPAGNGAFIRLTFTRAEEAGPRLSPSGTMVAFFRRIGSRGEWSLVVLNLLSSAERVGALDGEGGGTGARRLGWSSDGSAVYVRDAAGRLLRTPAPPAPLALAPVPPAESAAADSALAELLGSPAEGRAAPCADGTACLLAASGESTSLGPGTTGAVRWGSDSVGYFSAGSFEVLPLAGGRTRRPGWSAVPSGLREVTYHPGVRESPGAVPGISPGTPRSPS